MIINLDNTRRVFLIERKGFASRTYFCNLHHIESILKNELDKYDEFTIKHFWNSKFTRIGKKQLNEMFEYNQIKFKLK